MKIFISCVSGEFRECRRSLASDLRSFGYDVMSQEDFTQEGIALLKKLEKYVDSCDAVIVLVGALWGAEGGRQDDRIWSYTQWEYHFAQGYRLGREYCAPAKDTYIYFASDEFCNKTRFQQSEEQRKQQLQHKQCVLDSRLDYGKFDSVDQLCRLVLKSGFNILDRSETASEREGYLRALSNEFGKVQFDTLQLINEQSGIHTPPALAAPISEVFVQPTVRRIVRFGANVAEYELGDVERDIVAAVVAADKPVVVLGPPGAGKTTSMQWLVHSLAQKNLDGESRLIPIFLNAEDLNAHPIKKIDEVITLGMSRWAHILDEKKTWEWMQKERHNLIFLIDGLDEVSSSLRESDNEGTQISTLLAALKASSEVYSEQKLVVTCRAQDYQFDNTIQLVDSENLLIPELTVQKVHKVIRAWQSFLVESGRITEKESQDNTLKMIAALSNSAQLASFVTNPRCLELFQLVSTIDDVSSSIPEIVNSAIVSLLFSKKALEGLKLSSIDLGNEDVWRDNTLDALANISAKCIQRDRGAGSDSFSFVELFESCARSTGADAVSRYAEHSSAASAMLAHLIKGHGVLISLNEQSFLFTQDVFRDVLAARYLNALTTIERIDLSSQSVWFQSFKYFGISLAQTTEGRYQALEFAVEIFKIYLTTQNHVQLKVVGEFFAAQVKRYETFVGPSSFENEYEAVRDTLNRYVNNATIADIERLEVGELLGRLGDLRIPSELRKSQSEEHYFIKIPSADYMLGGSVCVPVDHPKYDEVQSTSPINIHVSECLLGRNLVTNLEFGKFIFDGGYDDPSYWDEGLARSWATQDAQTIEYLVDAIWESASLHLYTNMSLGRLTEAEIDESLRVMIQRKQPIFWYDRRYNSPNQPVVGVNIWEARAFSRWCNTGKLYSNLSGRYEFDLPTEYEWEAAGKIFYEEVDCANSCYWNRLEGFGSRTAPIGLFPNSMNVRNGPFDLVGNVWEWTTSNNKIFGSLPVDVDSSELQEYFVRGGSWLSTKPLTHDVCFRSYDPPCNSYEDLGFRLKAKLRT